MESVDESHKKAYALFQDGAYEEALDAICESDNISDEDSQNFIMTCNEMIVDQYKILINQAIADKNYDMARRLKYEYLVKHYNNDEITDIEIPENTAIETTPEANSVSSEIESNIHTGEITDTHMTDNDPDALESLSAKKSCSRKKYFLWVALCIVLFAGVGLLFLAIPSGAEQIEGWTIGYLPDEQGNDDLSEPYVSKSFQTRPVSDQKYSETIQFIFTKDGFIVNGDKLPIDIKTIFCSDNKTNRRYEAWFDSENQNHIAKYNKVGDLLINLLDNEESSIFLVFDTKQYKSHAWLFNGTGGKGLKKAINQHIINNPDVIRKARPDLRLTTWIDSMAYAIGVNYINDKEKTFPLKNYIKDTFHNITGEEEYDKKYNMISQRGMDDAMTDNTLFSSDFAKLFLEFLKCDISIQSHEKRSRNRVPHRAKEFRTGMNCAFRKMNELMNTHSEINYTPHFVPNYFQRIDSILSLPEDAFVYTEEMRYNDVLKEISSVPENKIYYKDGRYIWYTVESKPEFLVYDNHLDGTRHIKMNKTDLWDNQISIQKISAHNGKITIIIDEIRNSNGWIEGTSVWSIDCATREWKCIAKKIANAKFIRNGSAVEITTATSRNPDDPTFMQEYDFSSRIINL
ncbi:MAG: hypothetical protein K2M94_06785 [Paramuribaculum sp.]|nr:hypothetical protein [Paramuribaculum sp.]